MRLHYRERLLEIRFNAEEFVCELLQGEPLEIAINGELIFVRDRWQQALK